MRGTWNIWKKDSDKLKPESHNRILIRYVFVFELKIPITDQNPLSIWLKLVRYKEKLQIKTTLTVKAFYKTQSSCITILGIISNLRSGVKETPSGQVHFSGIVPAPQGFFGPFTHSPSNVSTSMQIKLLFVFDYNIYIYI